MLILPFFILGAVIGSFLNVVIVRLHQGQSMTGRSRCPACRAMIRWYDNIPLLSFALLRGRCRHCQAPIAWQYPLVELATGLLFVASLWARTQFLYPVSGILYLVILRDLIFISFLIVIFVYDLRWGYILDRVTVPAALVALAYNLALGMHWSDLFGGAIIGGGFFLAQFAVSKGAWIGGGDIRLGVVMGLMLGWQSVLVALLIAYVTGATVGMVLLARGQKKLSSQVPFGTFLTLGTALALFYGQSLIQWYLSFL